MNHDEARARLLAERTEVADLLAGTESSSREDRETEVEDAQVYDSDAAPDLVAPQICGDAEEPYTHCRGMTQQAVMSPGAQKRLLRQVLSSLNSTGHSGQPPAQGQPIPANQSGKRRPIAGPCSIDDFALIL